MQNSRIIYFDGICNLCNFWIRLVRKFDKKHSFQFVSIQSAQEKGILTESVLELDSVIYSRNNQFHFESDAILWIIHDLGGKFHFLYFILRLFPRFLRQVIYKFIARNRYRFFGTCEVGSG